MQEKDADVWMLPEHKEILKNRETIAKEFKEREKSLVYLCGVVSDLFVDWQRSVGSDAVHRIAEVHKVIRLNDFEKLVDFFQKSQKK